MFNVKPMSEPLNEAKDMSVAHPLSCVLHTAGIRRAETPWMPWATGRAVGLFPHQGVLDVFVNVNQEPGSADGQEDQVLGSGVGVR